MPAELHYHTDAYWCAECHAFTLECSHLAEPLRTPAVRLKGSTYISATWDRNTLELRTNTGEGYQFAKTRAQAIAFVRDPREETLKGLSFRRVRGKAA